MNHTTHFNWFNIFIVINKLIINYVSYTQGLFLQSTVTVIHWRVPENYMKSALKILVLLLLVVDGVPSGNRSLLQRTEEERVVERIQTKGQPLRRLSPQKRDRKLFQLRWWTFRQRRSRKTEDPEKRFTLKKSSNRSVQSEWYISCFSV